MKVGFFSYKGGVGRTKVMVGTAVLMALRGYRIGLIDFDLDASGLATIFGDQEKDLGQKELLHILQRNSKRLAIDSLIAEDELVKERLGKNPQTKGGALKYIPTISNPRLSDDIKFNKKFRNTVDELFDHLVDVAGINYLFIDMKPGYSPSASLVLPLCQRAVVIARLDDQNIFGLGRSLPLMIQSLKLDPILVANMLPNGPSTEKEVELRIGRLEKATNHRVDVRISYEVESVFDNDFSSLKNEGSDMYSGLSTVAAILSDEDS